MFCCKVDTIIQDIDARLEEIKSKYIFMKTKQPVSNPIRHVSPLIEPTSLPESLPSSFNSVVSVPNILDNINNTKKNKHNII
jgi:hypothetical protein